MLFPSWQILGFKKTNDQTQLKKKAVTDSGNFQSVIAKIIVTVSGGGGGGGGRKQLTEG